MLFVVIIVVVLLDGLVVFIVVILKKLGDFLFELYFMVLNMLFVGYIFLVEIGNGWMWKLC